MTSQPHVYPPAAEPSWQNRCGSAWECIALLFKQMPHCETKQIYQWMCKREVTICLYHVYIFSWYEKESGIIFYPFPEYEKESEGVHKWLTEVNLKCKPHTSKKGKKIETWRKNWQNAHLVTFSFTEGKQCWIQGVEKEQLPHPPPLLLPWYHFVSITKAILL